MGVKYVSFEGQTSGTTWNVANSGGGSGDAINTQTGGGTATFSTAWSMTGTRSLLINTSANQAMSVFTINTPQIAFREYWYFNTLPTSAQDQCSTITGPKLQMEATTGKLKVLNAAGTLVYTFTNAFSATTAYRVQAYFATAATNSTGTIKVAIFAGHSQTAIEEYTAIGTANAGTANYTEYRFGKLTGGAVALNKHIDDVAYDDAATDYIGPSVVTTTCVPASGLGSIATVSISSGVSVVTTPARGMGSIVIPTLTSAVTITTTAATGWGTVRDFSVVNDIVISVVPMQGWGGIRAPGITSAVSLTASPVSGIGSTPPPALTSSITVSVSSVPGWGSARAPGLTAAVSLSPSPAPGSGTAPSPALSSGAVLSVSPVSGWAGIRAPSVGASVTVFASLATGWGGVRAPGMTSATNLRPSPASGTGVARGPLITTSTTLSVILTRAQASDRAITPAGTMRVRLTRAEMLTGYRLAVILTRAQAVNDVNMSTEVSIGTDKIVPPFKSMALAAALVNLGLVVDSWTWTILSSNPRAVVVPVLSGPGNSVITYKAPALVKGTVLTISATAHFSDRPDSSAVVTHMIRPHSWPWRMNAQGIFYPVNRFPVE